MKKKFLISNLFALGVLLVLASCGKEEPIPKTNSDFIVGSWVLTDAMIDPPDFATGSDLYATCLLYTSPSPRDKRQSRMPSSA